MLPIQYRLRKREDFDLVYSKGSYVFSSGITLKYVATKNPTSRIGFPVSKTFSKKAAERNRVRRILREATFTKLNSLKSGFDIAIMIKPGTKLPSLQEASATLGQLFKKANLLI